MGTFKGFTQVQLAKPKRSMFDLSNVIRTSTRMGRLTPMNIVECLPGDYFNGSCEVLIRVAPMLSPLYDNIQAYVHHYFVANRIVWDEWEDMITAGRLGPNDTDPAPIPPCLDLGSVMATNPELFERSSLADYLGVPMLLTIDPTESNWDGKLLDLLPFAAYQLVYQEYYRDRNFEDDDTLDLFPLSSGENSDAIAIEMLTLRTRYYMRDYFTSALPFTQRGDEVLMPLAGTGSVTYLANSMVKKSSGGSYGAPEGLFVMTDESLATDSAFPPVSAIDARIENIDEVILDASSVSINDFRSAYALQVWLERNAIAGSRYTESIQAHFGVKPRDSRLQRPEYLGGYRVPIKISEVVSTAYSNDGVDVVPLGNLGGHGIGYGNSNRYRYFVPEHGFIISILSIMNAPAYHQGLHPMFYRRRTFLSYPFPTFAKLGEQNVDKVELYCNPANLTETNGARPLFGYQSRYADWKWNPSGNRGDFHDTLLFWTLTRNFSSSPELGQTFAQFDDASQNRIFAVGGDGDNFWVYCHNNVHVKRALPYFGTPNTLGFA